MEQEKVLNVTTARVYVARPWLAMVGMLLGAFIGMLSETSLNIALPKLMTVFNVNTATIQWLVTGYMLIIGIVLPFSSLLSKWFTTRQLIIFGLIDFIVGSLISATASNFAILLLGRMIQGIGTGLILPLMFTVATLIFPPLKLGLAMGICALIIMFAPAIGPTLTGLILGKLTWNWIFWLFIPFLVIALLFTATNLKNVSEISHPKVDWISVIESIIGFSSLVIGTSMAAALGWTSLSVIAALIIGIVILALYVYRQLTITNPVLNLKVFKKAAFTKGTICVMLDFSIILSAMFLLPQFMQNGLLLPVALTGIMMLPGGVINAIISAIAGRLFDSFGAKILATSGFALAIIGILMLLGTTASSSTAYVIAAHIILMIGCPLAMSPSQSHALNALVGVENADGSTIMNTLQQVVGAVATAIATSFLGLGQQAYHAHNSAAQFTNGFHYGLIFTLIVAILGLFVALNLTGTKKDQQSNV